MADCKFNSLILVNPQQPGFAHSLYHRLSIFSKLLSATIPWLVPAIALLMFTIVVLRYGFSYGNIAMQEINIYFNCLLFMSGGIFLFRLDEHIRLDIFYKGYSPKTRAQVNLFGTLFFLLPMMITIFLFSWEYVIDSWAIRESSHDTDGLPGVYFLKSLLLAMPILFFIEAFNEIMKNILILKKVATISEKS